MTKKRRQREQCLSAAFFMIRITEGRQLPYEVSPFGEDFLLWLKIATEKVAY